MLTLSTAIYLQKLLGLALCLTICTAICTLLEACHNLWTGFVGKLLVQEAFQSTYLEADTKIVQLVQAEKNLQRGVLKAFAAIAAYAAHEPPQDCSKEASSP